MHTQVLNLIVLAYDPSLQLSAEDRLLIKLSALACRLRYAKQNLLSCISHGYLRLNALSPFSWLQVDSQRDKASQRLGRMAKAPVAHDTTSILPAHSRRLLP